MPSDINVGIDGVNKEMVNMAVGVSGSYRRVSEIYVGVGGAWKNVMFESKALEALPVAKCYHAAGHYDGKIIVACGHYQTPESPSYFYGTNTVYSYDIATGAWTQKTSAPANTSRGQCGVYDNKLHIVGGVNGLDWRYNYDTYAYVYDMVNNSWASYYVGYGHGFNRASCVVGSKMYMFGGTPADGNYPYPSNKAEYYDMIAHTCTPIANRPLAQFYGIAFHSGGKIYLCNGQDQNGTMTMRTDIYDIATNTWSVGQLLDIPSSNARAVDISDTIKLIYGHGYVWKLDVATWSYTTVYAMPEINHQSFGVSAVADVDNNVYVMGGYAGTDALTQHAVSNGRIYI